MSLPTNVPHALKATPARRRTGIRSAVERIWPRRFSLTLAKRFLIANLAILLVAGLAIGVWVGNQLERGIIDRTASITALYVENFIEPPVSSLATGEWLTQEDTETLDRVLGSTALGDRIVALKIWSPSGVVLYSADRELIGRSFPIDEGLGAALSGRVFAEMSPLDQAENAVEAEEFDHLLEMYVPVREPGTDRIIAAAEFYQLPTQIDSEVNGARLGAWAVVGIAVILSYLLLYGIVRQGSETITLQRRALESQVMQLTDLNRRNEALNERVRQAAERNTMLTERSLRRISSDLHDGPGQMLSLALMRLGALRRRQAAEGTHGAGAAHAESSNASDEAAADVESALRDALRDMRAIAAGLRLPELEPMTTREVVQRAVDDHVRRSGTPIALTVDESTDAAAHVDLAVKIALFRALQELLSNATRHAGGAEVSVHVSTAAAPGRPVTALRLTVSDRGPGFDPAELPPAGSRPDGSGLGLAGVRESAELLGGGFAVTSSEGAGTTVDAWWPVGAASSGGGGTSA
jgi:signal transduction histidine kinase